MLKIALTGGIGSGKTTVSNYFHELGIDIIDADVIARQITSPEGAAHLAIVEHFGHKILESDRTLNRTLLRHIIFNNPEEKIWLENLTHPLIRSEIRKQLDQSQSPYSITVIPLLIQSDHYQYIHRICVVDVESALQIQRASQRDANNPELISKIVATQTERKQRLKLADDIIHNNGSFDQLKEQVNQLHRNYLQLASQDTWT